MQDLLKTEEGDNERMLHNIHDLATQLYQNVSTLSSFVYYMQIIMTAYCQLMMMMMMMMVETITLIIFTQRQEPCCCLFLVIMLIVNYAGKSKPAAIRSEDPQANRWCLLACTPACLSFAWCDESDGDHWRRTRQTQHTIQVNTLYFSQESLYCGSWLLPCSK